MTLKKINIFIALFLSVVVSTTFIYTYKVTKNYFKEEHATRIKGDILELGYSLAKSMEQEGLTSSLNLMYKSLATHKEYQSLSIYTDKKVVLSTDRKLINTIYDDAVHIDKLKSDSMQLDKSFYHEFTYFDGDREIEFFLLIKLDHEYLMASEKEIQNLISSFIIYFVIITMVFFVLLYILNIRPLIKLSELVEKKDYRSQKFFIEEFSTLYKSFGDKYREIELLNETLEEKVKKRTLLLNKINQQFKEAQELTRLGNWEWDIRTNSIVWSDEIYRVFGLKPQEFAATYEAFMNTIHIDDRELVQEAVNKALSTGEDYNNQNC